MFLQRRTIAIFILALFSCQLLMASVADPCALYSDLAHPELQSSIVENNSNTDDLDSNSLPLIVQECEHCCQSSGHCHILSISPSAPSLSAGSTTALLFAFDQSYQSRSSKPLHRPPISA